MTFDQRQHILDHCRPLRPIAVDCQPRLQRLSDISAVLFDIYGTLLISASGDIGAAEENTLEAAFAAALDSAGLSLQGGRSTMGGAGAGAALLRERIEAVHAKLRSGGVEFPEVDIREIWMQVLHTLRVRGQLVPPQASAADAAHIALDYELRTNPVWPMPGAKAVLQQLRDRGFVLGLVSNAQYFTEDIVTALLEDSLEKLGVDESLRCYSYRYGHAKPGTFLYNVAQENLQRRGIDAGNVLYVGNDRLNDVLPASQAGFRTALFAGDARSFRPRESDARVQGIEPDLVITELPQLIDCVGGTRKDV